MQGKNYAAKVLALWLLIEYCVHVFPERVKLRQHLSGITPGPCCNQACVPFPAREQSRCGEIAGACDQAQFVIPEKQIALCMKPFDF